ncbi:MAG: hypothetical protein SGPRY_014362 [Prymnesium sp.]
MGHLSDVHKTARKAAHLEPSERSSGKENCTIVNFRHIIKTGGTTVRGWMTTVALLSGEAIIRDREAMFCPVVNASSRTCLGANSHLAQLRQWAHSARKIDQSRIMVESHIESAVFRDITLRRTNEVEGTLVRPWPSYLGCKAIVAVLWRDPPSMYHSLYRFILDKRWGNLNIVYKRGGCLKQPDGTCKRSPLPLSDWIFNRTEHYTPHRDTMHAPRNSQTSYFLAGLVKTEDDADLSRAGLDWLQKVDLAGTTEDISTFLVLLCQLSGIQTCPQHSSTNVNVQVGDKPSTVLHSELSEDIVQYVRSRLAPVDQVLYSEVQARFYKQAEPFAEQVRAYRATPQRALPFKWQLCSDSANVFQQGLRIGERYRRNVTSRFIAGNYVISPLDMQVTDCTDCKQEDKSEVPIFAIERCKLS